MTHYWNQAQNFFWNIFHRLSWIDLIEIGIVAFLIYQLVVLIRQTRAIQVLKGLAVLRVHDLKRAALSVHLRLHGVTDTGHERVVELVDARPHIDIPGQRRSDRQR